jgi:hypothetical protein
VRHPTEEKLAAKLEKVTERLAAEPSGNAPESAPEGMGLSG